MVVRLLLCYLFLLVNLSRCEVNTITSEDEDYSIPVLVTGEVTALPTETDYHIEKHTVSDNVQTEFPTVTTQNTEESADINTTSTVYTTSDSSSTSDDEQTTCGVPGPVSDLTIEDLSPNSLNISWQPPSYGNNCVDRYMISWSDSSTDLWNNETTNTTYYTIEDLDPCTQYVIYVYAESNTGEISQANNSTNTTSSDVPGPVSDVTIEDISPNSLNISWQPPSYGNNCVDRYMISWSDSSTDLWNNETTNTTYYTIEDLDPCTQYVIYVYAESNTGEVSQANNSTKITSSDVPGSVSDLTIEDLSPNSLNISWQPPSYGNNCVDRYMISWSNSSTNLWNNETTNTTYYTIEDLDPCTQYVIYVYAESNTGEISQANNSTKTTSSDVPGPVSDVTIEDLSPNSLNISWQPPSYGNNCVDRYMISWSDSSTDLWNNETTNTTYYTIEDLDPCTQYVIYVYAESNTGEISQGNNSTKTTSSDVPGPVADLTIEDLSPNSLNISWQPPSYGNNCVDRYMISWSDSSTDLWNNETTNTTYYTIEGLDPCTQYVVYVYAESNTGEISQANSSTKTTSSDVPGPISYLAIGDVSAESVNVSWPEPSYGSNCVNWYVISWSDTSTTKWNTETTSSLYYTIEDLNPCTTYVISVVAEGNNNETSEATNTTVTTASAVPGPIYYLAIVDVSAESVNVSWLEPSYGSNCVNWYVISWSDTSTTKWNTETTSSLYYTIEDLNPCTTYVISVVAEGNNNETSEATNTTVTTASTVPGPVTILSSETITSPHFLNISWMAPSFGNNCVTSYIILWREDAITAWSQGTTTEVHYVIEDLIPCTEYFISVVAEGNSGEISEPRYSNETTASVVPDPVLYLTSGFVYPDERNVLVILNWKLPDSLKRILTGILIAYEGHDFEMSDSEVDMKEIFWNDTSWDIDTCCTYTLSDLYPDYDYSVSVSTATKCEGLWSEPRWTSFRYPAGVPTANQNSLRNLKPDPFATANPTKQAMLTIYSDFFNEEYGRIKSYAIIVAQESYQENPQSHRLNGSKPIMNNWHNATAGEIIWPYQATEDNWNPFVGLPVRSAILSDVKQTTFTLGTDECTNPATYCNGELRPDTNYSVKMRAFTTGGYQDSQLFYFVTDSEVPVGMILGILFSIVSLGAAGIAYFMYRNGILSWPPLIFKTLSVVSVPPPAVSIKKFPAHCTQMLQIPNKLSNEYQLLATLSADVYSNNTFLAAQNPENKKKNRYVNILPYDSTRVTLEIIDDDPFSDYINASFIKGYSNDIEYIASQGPKEETYIDFWRMIFQHSVHLIVMVTNLVENEKVKCYKYYPNLRETIQVGDMTIGCTSEINFPVYTARTFLINKGERRRQVMQLHFREWPDFGTPHSSHSMIQFVHTVRDHAAREVGLTLVHCSAGVGRTGTLIALDILLQHICEHKNIDVFGTVFKLRKQRINMVQTEGQYAYIYKCIKEALEDPALLSKNNSTTNSLEPIYENVGTSLKNLQYERLSQVRLKNSSSESECEL